MGGKVEMLFKFWGSLFIEKKTAFVFVKGRKRSKVFLKGGSKNMISSFSLFFFVFFTWLFCGC